MVALVSFLRVVVSWVARRGVVKAAELLGVGVTLDAVATGGEIFQILDRLNHLSALIVEQSTGLDLGGDLSRKSVAKAIAEKAGVPLRDPFDKDILREDLDRYAVAQIYDRSGVAIRSLSDKQGLIEDLESHALDQLQAKTGYRLSSLTDATAVKEDLMSIGMQIAQDRTGVPLAGIKTPDDAKDALIAWATPLVFDRLLAAVPSDESLAGGNTLIHQIKQRLGPGSAGLSSREIVRAVHSHIVASSVDLLVRAPATGKVDRRRLQLRWAQKKFRERHKKREIYVPLGFVAETRYVGGDNG